MPTAAERKVPLKADLLEAQRNWLDVMEEVVGEQKIKTITDGGKPVAVIVPIDLWKIANERD